MKPRLIVEQKITPLVNKYDIYDVSPENQKAGLKAHVQQKRIALKEKITFYSDETKSSELFTLAAEKILDVHGQYYVKDSSGKKLGSIKKDFKKSLTNSTWLIHDTKGNPILNVTESSPIFALVRRFVGFIPIVGEIFDVIASMVRYHFVIKDNSTGEIVGRYEKTTRFRDHYSMSLTDETFSATDWRVFASLAIALDALQSR